MSRVLVTGAGGFVGCALVPVLEARGHDVVPATRAIVGDIGPGTDWSGVLGGVDTVVHLAARVHVMRDEAPDPEAAFDRVNVAGTRRLAEAAAASGVRRFVVLSSVKVNGDSSGAGAFTEADAPAPQDPYGRSKLAAEQALARVASGRAMEVVILRPPLVYGPEAKANFAALLRLAASPWPLPFGAIANRRSLIHVGNLADAIARVVESGPGPGCRTYLVSDGEDLSTGEMVAALRAGLGKGPRLVSVPPRLLILAAGLAGREAEARRLTESLQVDSRLFRRDFAWRAPLPARQALEETARAFAGRQSAG